MKTYYLNLIFWTGSFILFVWAGGCKSGNDGILLYLQRQLTVCLTPFVLRAYTLLIPK